MRVSYNGQETLTFGDYIDLGTGKTLLAGPGGVYDITPASGRLVDDVPVPWFTALEDQQRDEALAAREAARQAAREQAEQPGGEDGTPPETDPETQPEG